MTSTEPQPDVLPPNPPGFQYSLRTLLLLFVVLASSLGVFGGWGIVVFAISVGLAVWIQHAESLPSLGCLVLVVLGLLFLAGLLLPAVMASRNLAVRMQCLMNVKQIALALQSYETVNGCFPPAYIADKNGKPMHSWRVLILPYLEEDALYKAYDFTEPWDGPKNRKLLATCPKEFVCPSDPRLNTSGGTAVNYVAVVGRNAAWAGAKPRKLADFTGGLSKTIMLVEVADSNIAWSEPRDLSLDALKAAGAKPPALTVSSNQGRGEDFFFIYGRRAGANVAMADGSVRYLPPGRLSTEKLLKILQMGGYGKEGVESYAASYNAEPVRLNWPNIAALAVWLLSVGVMLTCAVRSRKARL